MSQQNQANTNTAADYGTSTIGGSSQPNGTNSGKLGQEGKAYSIWIFTDPFFNYFYKITLRTNQEQLDIQRTLRGRSARTQMPRLHRRKQATELSTASRCLLK